MYFNGPGAVRRKDATAFMLFLWCEVYGIVLILPWPHIIYIIPPSALKYHLEMENWDTEEPSNSQHPLSR
jgi:hypothetical protein